MENGEKEFTLNIIRDAISEDKKKKKEHLPKNILKYVM